MRMHKISHKKNDGEVCGWEIHTGPERKAWYLFEGDFEHLASAGSVA